MIMNLNRYNGQFTGSPKLHRNLFLIACGGALVTILGVFLAPERTWPNFLLASYYLLSLGLAGVVFVALQYVSNAGWAVGIRRVPEAIIQVLPLGVVLMMVTMIGIPTLYEWSHAESAGDHLLRAKTDWLNIPFFIGRTVAYVALWITLATALVRNSRKQDADGDVVRTQKNKKLSAVFLVIFGYSFTLASMDWIMSLEPKWYSTIFGIYNFTGMLLNGLAAITILVIVLRRLGPLQKVVNESHLHDLGKLIFAFSTFWMYIWFSQYVLIWYANIPEEVIYYVRREQGGWQLFTWLNVVFNWVIPFVVLISQWSKRNEGLLLKVCIIIMIGHWIDLYWMILPPFIKSGPEVSIWEVGPIAGSVALFFFATLRSFAKATPIPVKDPMLIESLHLHG